MENITEQPTQDNVQVPPSLQDTPIKSSSSSVYIYLGLALLVLIVVLIGGYVLYQKNQAKNSMMNSNKTQTFIQITPTPTTVPVVTPVTPVTASNSDQSLNDTDSGIQQSLNQVDSDMNSLNSVDTGKDNPNNL